MSLVKPEDFAKALNISYGTIRSKISRKGLLRNKNKLIDTEHPLNFAYLIEVNGGDQSVFEPYEIKSIGRTNVNKKITPANKTERKVIVSHSEKNIPTKSASKNENVVSEKTSKISTSVKKSPVVDKKLPEKHVPTKLSAEEKFERDLQRKHNQTLLEVDIEQKKANLDISKRTAEIKRMQLEKAMGNTLPLDQVMSIMAINFKAVFKSFNSQLKNIAFTMVQNLGGTKDNLNEIMNELEKSLNHIKEMSKENADREIERLVQEYSEVRSRGERKL